RTIEVELTYIGTDEFVPVGVSQHANHGGIHIQQIPSWIAEVHALLESFKEFGKAGLTLALRGNITRQTARPHNLAVLYNRLQNAIEIMHGPRFLKSRAHRAGPFPSLLEPSDGFFQTIHSRLVKEFVHPMPNQFGVGKAENLGDALIHG